MASTLISLSGRRLYRDDFDALVGEIPTRLLSGIGTDDCEAAALQ